MHIVYVQIYSTVAEPPEKSRIRVFIELIGIIEFVVFENILSNQDLAPKFRL